MHETPPPLASDAPFFIVLNAGSGQDDAARRRAVITEVLGAAGRAHELLLIEPGGRVDAVAAEAVRRAKAGAGAVVAAGGDGTINTVAARAIAEALPFGVLPQGTFNYFSRVWGIPSDPADAVRALLRARLRPAQAGLLNERVFLVNASIGLYPQLLEDREAWKRRYGRNRLVALWAGLRTLLSAHRPLRLRIDGERRSAAVRTSTLFVGNNRLQLDRIGVLGAPALDRGQLVAIMLRPVGTLAMLGLILRGAIGRLGEDDDVIHFPFERMVVRPAAPLGRVRMKVATDGEIRWLRAPLEFRVSPRPLWLLAPAPEDAVEAA
ncbi:MAG: diacylglycerol kinase family protein [Burkholderiaceae bacterium]